MGHYFMNDDNLASEMKQRKMLIKGREYLFWTDNGVFSKEHLDEGTKLLIETLPILNGDILDIGTGYGPIGIYVANNYDTFVDMIDINNRALHLAKMNVELNKINNANVFFSDAYKNVTKKYSYIISNPPIRVGKEKLYEILFNAKNYLLPDGELWFVIRKDQGAKSAIKDLSLEYIVDVVKKSKGFYIIRAKLH